MFDWLNYIPHFDLMAWTFWLTVFLAIGQGVFLLALYRIATRLPSPTPKPKKKLKQKGKKGSPAEPEVVMKTEEDEKVVVFY